MNRVKAGIFSFTASDAGDHETDYLRWHLLDHMPEQYQLPGIVLGSRWIADGAYPGSCIAAHERFGDLRNVVNYLVGDNVEKTLQDFVRLGSQLREMGRFPHAKRPLQLAGPALLRAYAAPGAQISSEVVPFRPHRGIVLLVEEPTGDGNLDHWVQWLHALHYPELVGRPGMAGAWMFGSTRSWAVPAATWHTGPQYITVLYLDDDPLKATASLASLIEQRWASGAVRPLYAGPLRTMIAWEAWR
ncbi:hypothetical protein [Mycobacterium sp.]|uniref:hypothetical protein n=1 Tax=Mycobacterium sp. TaxID=1785 RepID=UPI003D12406E